VLGGARFGAVLPAEVQGAEPLLEVRELFAPK